MKQGKLTLGLIASSFKENEKRAAIHPVHFRNFDEETRRYVYAEKGFGRHFRVPDEEFAPHVAGLRTREELLATCDAVMIFKPVSEDFPSFREGQVLWGACHNVQNPEIVQTAIDKRMTLIAMESMHLWNPDGSRSTWLYHTQSELAGYCSTLHGLQLLGIKGWHDQPRRAAIISFGSSGRGAVHALTAMDFHDITVYTQRPPVSVQWAHPMLKIRQYVRDPDNGTDTLVVREDGSTTPFGEELAGYEIIVNCVAQDTDRPLMFLRDEHLAAFRRDTLIVDVSCDRGLGFPFARPTRFDDPIFTVGKGVVFYAVDHSPSLLWDTAAREHSKVCHRYVKDVVGGVEAWDRCPTVGKAVEIRDGVVVEPRILTYQNREPEYPHRRRG